MIPKEGSRDIGDGIIISLSPDVCLTPVGSSTVPVPYSVFAYQSDDANTAATVRMTGKRAHNMGSVVTVTKGDGPGSSGGVVSGTVGAACHPKGHSATVNIQGKPALRHGDEWYMNNKNTVGKLTYVKSGETWEPTPAIIDNNTPGSKVPPEFIQLADASPNWAQLLDFAPPAPETVPEVNIPGIPPSLPETKTTPVPPPKDDNRHRRPPKSMLPPVLGLGRIVKQLDLMGDLYQSLVRYGEIIRNYESFPRYGPNGELLNPSSEQIKQDLMEQFGVRTEAELQELIRQAELQTSVDAKSDVTGKGTRVTRDEKEEEPDPCEVGPYREMQRKCSQRGGQAHHIVPDFTLRAGPRPDLSALDPTRLPNAPTLAQGMAICLTGHAKTQGGEHFAAHSLTDNAIKKAGAQNRALPGTADWLSIRQASLDGIEAAKPDCLPAAKAAIDAQFAGMPGNQALRAVMDYRTLPQATRDALSVGTKL
jgi:hypothetical protein